MDPEESLRFIRKFLDKWVPVDHSPPIEELDDFYDHVPALEEWITSGGFLPRAWSKHR